MSIVQSTLSLIILISSLWLTACASSGPNANLNEMATLEALEARMEALEAKTNRGLEAVSSCEN